MISNRVALPVFLTMLLAAPLRGQEYFFYRPLDYGSDAMFNPVSVIFNGGLDVLQSYNKSTRASEIKWNIGATSIWQSVRSPGYWISRYGWDKFLKQEVLPTSLDVSEAQWAPNYTLHLICGGMEYRKLSEWYDYHNFPLPFVLGAITAMGYHFFNELVENGPHIHGNTDAIADFCIFDPLGIVIFSFDGVARYFSSTFSLNDWSPQPSVSLGPLAFRNFAHSFVMRYPLDRSEKTKIFLHLGKSTLLGLSFRVADEDAVSFGAGATQTGVWEVNSSNGIPTNSINVGAACGIFYDRNNSLLVSILASEYHHEILRINVYPGVFFLSSFSPGFFFTMEGNGTYAAGLTMRFSPLGLGFYSPAGK